MANYVGHDTSNEKTKNFIGADAGSLSLKNKYLQRSMFNASTTISRMRSNVCQKMKVDITIKKFQSEIF